jgi:hypothetical protein
MHPVSTTTSIAINLLFYLTSLCCLIIKFEGAIFGYFSRVQYCLKSTELVTVIFCFGNHYVIGYFLIPLVF